jgi:hypothetical protein
MSKTPLLDVITQQLTTLSLEQLLEVRARVNALIEEKTSTLSSKTQQPLLRLEDLITASNFSLTTDQVRYLIQSKSDLEVLELRNQAVFIAQCSEADEEDNSLEKVISLVEKWMADESGYDDEIYPQIEASLSSNQMSL